MAGGKLPAICAETAVFVPGSGAFNACHLHFAAKLYRLGGSKAAKRASARVKNNKDQEALNQNRTGD